jgi:hypothetical protein
MRQPVRSAKAPTLKNNDNFDLARSLRWMLRGPMVGFTKKGSLKMTTIFTLGRETATALAAAFVTAMLFVSSATSLLPIA